MFQKFGCCLTKIFKESILFVKIQDNGYFWFRAKNKIARNKRNVRDIPELFVSVAIREVASSVSVFDHPTMPTISQLWFIVKSYLNQRLGSSSILSTAISFTKRRRE